MNAKELMIGDLVQNPLGWKARVQSIKYTNIIKEQWEWLVRIGLNNETFQSNLSLNEIAPIELLGTMLLDNGFKYSPFSNGIFTYKSDNGEFSCMEDKGYWLFWVNENQIANHFHYVHELQHALRLCGFNEKADDFFV